MFAPSIDKRVVGREKGRYVVIVGPDGSGKTTLAATLLDRVGANTAYFHFLPIAWLDRPPTDGGNPPPKKAPDRLVLGWLRLGRNTLRAMLWYMTRVRPAVRAGTFVVADRWIYGYLGQPGALRFSGPAWLARLAVALLPAPDLVVNLAAPPELVVARKAELTESAAEEEMARWQRLPVASLVTLDASETPDRLADQVLGAVRWR